MILTVVSAAVTAYLSFRLFRQASGTLSLGKINVISYVYYLSVLQVLIGAILVNLGYAKHYTLDYLAFRTDAIEDATVAAYLMMIGLPFVMLTVYKVLRFDPAKQYEDFLKKDIVEKHNDLLFWFLLIVSVIQCALLGLMIIKIGYIPAMKIVFSDSSMNYGLERQRIEAIQLFGISYIKNLLIIFGIPIVSYITFAFAVANRELKWIALAFVMFIASGITNTYDFSKSPMIFHLFVFMLMIIYFRKGIRNIVMVGFGACMAAILVVMYRATGFGSALNDIYGGILGRTLFTQFGVLAYHMEYFGKIGGFLAGRSLSPSILKLIGMDPATHMRSGKVIMGFYGSRSVYDGTAGVMNTNFVGEAYANFGWAGLVFSIVWVGLVISLLFYMIIKIKKTPATIAFLAVMTKSIGAMTQGGFFDFIYSFSTIVTIVGFLIIIYFSDITGLLTGKRKKAKIAAAAAGAGVAETVETAVPAETVTEEPQTASEDVTRNDV